MDRRHPSSTALCNAICKATGWRIIEEPDKHASEHPDQQWHLIETDETVGAWPLRFRYWGRERTGKRIVFRIEMPKDPRAANGVERYQARNLVSYEERQKGVSDSIAVNPDRDPAALAKDIERRLLTQGRRFYELAATAHQRDTMELERHRRVLDEVRAIEPTNDRAIREDKPDQATFWVGGLHGYIYAGRINAERLPGLDATGLRELVEVLARQAERDRAEGGQ